MSSWGSWSKISKLQQVGYFSFFGSKSSLFNFTTTLEAFFAKNANLRALTNLTSNPYSVLSGAREDLHTRTEGPSLHMDGWDGRSIKSVLQCSSYFVAIQNIYETVWGGGGIGFFFIIFFLIIFCCFLKPLSYYFYHIFVPTNFLSYLSLSYFDILKNLYHILYHIFSIILFLSYFSKT